MGSFQLTIGNFPYTVRLMSLTQKLLADVEAFLDEIRMAETTFGLRALNDGKFVSRLRSGAGITIKTLDRVNTYMAAEREKGSGTQRRQPRRGAA